MRWRWPVAACLAGSVLIATAPSASAMHTPHMQAAGTAMTINIGPLSAMPVCHDSWDNMPCVFAPIDGCTAIMWPSTPVVALGTDGRMFTGRNC
jgi:hypothetical protein